MKDPHKLANLLTKNIMIYHDAEDYIGLKKNSEKLLKEMGYNKKISFDVSSKIKKIYINYDLAQIEFEKKNFLVEKKYYFEAKKLASNINLILGDGNDYRLLVDIVIQWRHKKKFVALFKIFEYWQNNLSLIKSIIATYNQILAGLAHDNRDQKKFEKSFEKIYCLFSKNNKFPLLF